VLSATGASATDAAFCGWVFHWTFGYRDLNESGTVLLLGAPSRWSLSADASPHRCPGPGTTSWSAAKTSDRPHPLTASPPLVAVTARTTAMATTLAGADAHSTPSSPARPAFRTRDDIQLPLDSASRRGR
jgi:hypothetical protein